MSDRLERLMAEMQDEVGNRSALEEARRDRLAEWFGGMLEDERKKSERTVSITELMRQAHGLGESDGDSETPPSSAA